MTFEQKEESSEEPHLPRSRESQVSAAGSNEPFRPARLTQWYQEAERPTDLGLVSVRVLQIPDRVDYLLHRAGVGSIAALIDRLQSGPHIPRLGIKSRQAIDMALAEFQRYEDKPTWLEPEWHKGWRALVEARRQAALPRPILRNY
jgi:hypothetical protein